MNSAAVNTVLPRFEYLSVMIWGLTPRSGVVGSWGQYICGESRFGLYTMRPGSWGFSVLFFLKEKVEISDSGVEGTGSDGKTNSVNF